MTDKELKLAIQKAIINFSNEPVYKAGITLFKTLGYNTERQNPLHEKTFEYFKDAFLGNDNLFNEEKACVKDWKSIDLLFQLTSNEVTDQLTLFDTKQVDNAIIESYLFFSIELAKSEYSRTQLAQITREINKVFSMPVLIVFKHIENITISIIDRRLNRKDDQKDVLEKVTVIKDISSIAPHRAHIEILFDLTFSELLRVHKFINFVELHKAWQKTLDTKELNKRFYRDISNWYFWAVRSVSFPNDIETDKDDMVYNSESVIRLLTRLIFIWFLKEKNLIPEEIFEEQKIRSVLKGFLDDSSNVYYRAILQNLFFATLNQKIEDRCFRISNHPVHYGVKTLYRYEKDFLITKEEVIRLFNDVPFLNGGLFDCLDPQNDLGKVMYLDGFSDNIQKQANVPDELFFSQDKTLDLSEIYDDKKKKNEKVKGLFQIFNSYKFTITENTPIEEEIALDPELLGRVFENLLASYNPETKTTARKQTGSFYTPREIVNYMVDESLIAYFKTTMVQNLWKDKSDELESELRNLLSYSETESKFLQSDKDKLIESIDNCKILDPSCGSGAFPMGILHKLVHVLHKLDPQNKLWKERQIKKASLIDDPAIRDNLIDDIETAFNNNELDYGRKLYLIENCIYGVDIQPIAAQISKLRFFISLIVNQRADKSKKNFAIRTLPNLETKFVAANTLIGLNKPEQGLLPNMQIQKLENYLIEIRHQYFCTKNRREKLDFQKKDKAIRSNISELLVKDGWETESAHQLAAWDPYNQNSSSPFFDSEWMFGIRDGFDIVIGNPPYGANVSEKEKQYYKTHYDSAKTIKGKQKGSLDTFTVFIEHGFNVLSNNGNLNFIVPIAITSSDSMSALHKKLEENCSPIKISSYSVRPQPVFENAVVNTSIIFFSKTGSPCKNIFTTKMYRKGKNFELQDLIKNLEFIDSQEYKLIGRYPKIGLKTEKYILKKLFSVKSNIGSIKRDSGSPVYYRTTGGRYFKVITTFSTGSTKEKPIYFDNNIASIVGAFLSSNLFFWFYQIYSNNLDLKTYEIDSFRMPIDKIDAIKKNIECIYNEYLEDIEKNARTRQSRNYANIDSFKEYKIQKSKHLIDKIDDLICPLYGLTNEETYFIKNYEIEYRLSDAEDEE